MTAPTRRAILGAAAWTAPAVAVAAAAPAYATSTVPEAPTCEVVGFKYPGQSRAPKSWTYVAQLKCSGGDPVAVIIGDKPATRLGDSWTAAFRDSRAKRFVTVHGADTVLFAGVVTFPPVKRGGA